MLCRLHGNRSIMSSRVSSKQVAVYRLGQSTAMQPWFYMPLCVARTYVAHGLAVLCCKGKAVRLLVSKIPLYEFELGMNEDRRRINATQLLRRQRPYETSLVAEWFKNSHPSEII